MSDLAVLDRVMTVAQVERHYVLSAEDLAHLPQREVLLAPLNTSSLRVRATFVTVEEHRELLRWKPTWELAHMALTAELRHLLQVKRVPGRGVRQAWTPEGGYGGARPDAEWHGPDGRKIAVEVDAGYPQAVVREKLKAFQQYDEVYWGTPSSVRRANLQSRYPGQAQFVSLDFTSSAAESK